MSDLIINSEKLSQRDIIENIIGHNFINDYGFITAISEDKKFVDVEHVIKPLTFNGADLEKTVTKKVELLFSSSSYISIVFDVKIGDGVFLVGLKDYVEKISEVTSPQNTSYPLHYKQENLKAIPFGFTKDATTKITIKEDELKIDSKIKNTVIDLKNKLTITTDADLEFTADNNVIKTTATSIEINNSSGSNRVAIDNNLLELKNSVSNLKAELQNLWTMIISLNTNLQSWTSTPAAPGSPVTPNPATLALFIADNVQNNINKTNVASFLK